MPEIPEGAAVPEDHKKAKKKAAKAEAEAAVAEASEEPTTVDFDGATYVVVGDLADLELMDDIATMLDGRWSLLGRVLKKLIGPGQYEAFKTAHRDEATGIVSTQPALQLFNMIDVALGK